MTIPAMITISAIGSQPLNPTHAKGALPEGSILLKGNIPEQRMEQMRCFITAFGMYAAGDYEDTDHLEEALLAYETVLAVDASQRLAHLGRGAILMQQDAWAESVAAFKEASRLDPEDALPYIYLGQVLDKSGREDAAWAAAAQRDPAMTQISRDMIGVSAHFKENGSEEDVAVWNQLTDQAESHKRNQLSVRQRKRQKRRSK